MASATAFLHLNVAAISLVQCIPHFTTYIIFYFKLFLHLPSMIKRMKNNDSILKLFDAGPDPEIRVRKS
jgi:hypothetical protein